MKTRLALLLACCTAFTILAAERPPLVPAGTAAPDFTAYAWDKRPVKLSDFKGKVVLVDFWSTWCGPCKDTMPHMEKLHQKLGGQDFVVLGVCVWDTQARFDSWQKKPEVKTSYLKVFDRAGSGANNIAKKLYKVSGIPTFYLIDRDGKILYSGVGSGPRTEAGLDRALKSAGLKI
jgi:thiol-disulfide isomerase/thioredoxin